MFDSGENPEMLKLLFGSADRKNSWMDAFQDTVGKFSTFILFMSSQLKCQFMTIYMQQANIQRNKLI